MEVVTYDMVEDIKVGYNMDGYDLVEYDMGEYDMGEYDMDS